MTTRYSLDNDPTFYCGACGEPVFCGELGDTRPHAETCPAAERCRDCDGLALAHTSRTGRSWNLCDRHAYPDDRPERISWRADDRRGTLLLDVFEPESIPELARQYGATFVRLPIPTDYFAPALLYRFTGRRTDLAAMLADGWDLGVSWLDDGTANLHDLYTGGQW